MSTLTPPPDEPTDEAMVIEKDTQMADGEQASTSSAAAEPSTDAAEAITENTSAPPPISDDYHEIGFKAYQSIAEQGLNLDYFCDCGEFYDLTGATDKSERRLVISVPLVLAYLARDELSLAKTALRRLPESLQSTPLISSLYDLQRSLERRTYRDIYDRISHLNVGELYPTPELASLCTTLLIALGTELRKRVLSLIARAYTSLPLARAEVMLGLAGDVILAEVEQGRGWTYDPKTQVLTPKHEVSFAGSGTSVAGSVDRHLDNFSSLVHSVVELEMN